MVRQLIKVDDFQLSQGRCVVVYTPQDIYDEAEAYLELVNTVVFVDSEYFVVTDLRLARVSFDGQTGAPYLDPFGERRFLGLIVRRAGRGEQVMTTLFG